MRSNVRSLCVILSFAIGACSEAGPGGGLQQVDGGTFMMGADHMDPAGSPDEFPRHAVEIAAPFEIGRTVVTRDQYAAFVEDTGYETASGCWILDEAGWRHDAAASWEAPGFPQEDTHPVVCVSLTDARAYLAWLSARTGARYRLPSEAEWDLAARGEAATPFWGPPENVCRFGNVNDLTAKNKVAKVAEPCSDGFMFTSSAGHFDPNPNGLFGMIGNVWEWTADCASDDYSATPRDGSAHVSPDCAAYVLRGHSWTDAPGPVRLETRYFLPADARQSIAGFRIVRAAE